MTTPDAAQLARRIAQGRGREPADLVVENVRLLDLVTGALTPTDIAICRRHASSAPTARIAAEEPIDGRGRVAVPGFIDTHLHVEFLARDAARIRPLRPAARGHHGDLRSARDRQRPRHRGLRLFPRMRRAHGDGSARPALELRAGDASRNRRRAHRGRRSRALSRPSESRRPRRVHEFSGRPRRRSRLPRQDRAVRGRPCRRPRAAALGPRPQRLYRRRHPHRARDARAPRRRWRKSARA